MSTIIDEPASPAASWRAAAENLLVNCAGIHAGSDVLFVNEDCKGVERAVVEFLETHARALGAKVRSVWPARAESPEAVPAELMLAIEAAEVTVFNHQIGPLLRLRPAVGNGVRVLNYATTRTILESEAARIPYGLWVEVMDRLVGRLMQSRTWRVQCPLGTDIRGNMPKAGTAPGGFTLRTFPMDTHPPTPSPGATGRIAFKWFVTSSMHDLGTEGIALDSPVLVDVENGRITEFDGDKKMIERARAFLAGIGERYGKDPYIVNSWHAGVNPQLGVSFTAKQSLEQWMLLAHGNPRILHFHVVGPMVPGEISAAVLDASVTFDDELMWDSGRLCAFDAEPYRALAARWPGGERAFTHNENIGV